jgi:hypothetical protein
MGQAFANSLVITRGKRMKRVPGTRRGPIVIASSYVLLLGGATGVSVAVTGLAWEQTAIFGLLLLWLVRAATVGVFIGTRDLKIRGWFRTVRLRSDSIERVEIRGYSGLMNRFTEGGLDPLHLFVRMFVIIMKDGREREFPSTAMSARQSRKTLARIVSSFPGIRRGPNDVAQASVQGKHAAPRPE